MSWTPLHPALGFCLSYRDLAGSVSSLQAHFPSSCNPWQEARWSRYPHRYMRGFSALQSPLLILQGLAQKVELRALWWPLHHTKASPWRYVPDETAVSWKPYSITCIFFLKRIIYNFIITHNHLSIIITSAFRVFHKHFLPSFFLLFKREKETEK